ncbi:MAG: glycosyltransferase [Myxococcota bacterium]
MKVLLLMSDTGGGHRASAQAIAEALRRQDARVEVEIVDIIKEMTPFWFRVVSLHGPIVRRAPWLWGLLYKLFGTSTKAPLWSLVVPLLILSIRRKILPFVQQRKPDVVCSTHPLINQTTQYARELILRTTGKHLPFMIVITDPVTFHPTWIEPRADAIVVATEAAQRTAWACGAPRERVKLLGLPIHPQFFDVNQPGSGVEAMRQAREQAGLPQDVPVVLVCAGGEGSNGMVAMVEEILRREERPHVVAVAGRNTLVQEQLEARAKGPDGERLHPLGFTTIMGTLMRASDVVVTKAGPGTLFEAMALGKPLVISDALPGQEQGNVDLVRDHGIGRIAMRGPREVADAVGELLSSESARAHATRNALVVSRPDASRDIARALLEMGARSTAPQSVPRPSPDELLHGASTKLNA